MDILLYLAVAVTLAYLGGLYLFGRNARVKFCTGGVEFILFGAVVGSQIPASLVADLFPFVHIELAWIGLLYGIQLELRRLRRHRPVEWILTFSESFAALLAVFIIAVLFLSQFHSSPISGIIAAAGILAAAASLSGPWPLGVLYEVYRQRGAQLRALRFVAGMDDLPGLVTFSALFFYPFRPAGLTACSVSAAQPWRDWRWGG